MRPRTDWFDRWAVYAPDAPALTDAESARDFTYAACARIINRCARVLRDEYGIAQGDRIAVLSTNEIEYIFLFFAAQKIGAVLVPMNFRLTARELAQNIRDCAPSLFVHQQQFDTIAADAVAAAVAAGPVAAVSSSIAATPDAFDGAPRRVAFDGAGSLTVQMYNEALSCEPVAQDADFDTPVMVLYTSGTTGVPKGAIITHGMMFWNSVNTTMRLNIVQQDVTLTFAPFFHTGGWNVLTTPFLHRGAHVILLKRFDPAQVLQLCDRAGVTVLFGVPTMMARLHDSEGFATASLRSVRYAIVGGEPMPVDLIRAWQEKGVPIRQGYGLTEFGPNVFSLNEDDAIRKIGSIGFPNFYVDTRIVDDTGKDLPPGAVGELLLRGPVCTPGYWNNPEATAATIRDGWLHTGDLVRRDDEGYHYVVDRKKDMFISGAENVYPAEIEHCLRQHAAVQAVAVIGVPDAKWGEVGTAFIVRRPDATAEVEDILEFCRVNLAKYKIPKYVVFLDELPVSDSGKILKKQLRAMYDGR
ncbi:MAG: long-chain fatty acid--CoA ligase [Bacteroidota bacterium]|jgi:fatty-acyl-CoA synthase|nr:long-chain fatty acid--CoA ligase [Bacteroidota bacterium]